MVHDHSISAKNEIDSNGTALTQRETIFQSIKNCAGTRQQVALRTGISINAVCGRVKELLNEGDIVEQGVDKSTGRSRAILVVNMAE